MKKLLIGAAVATMVATPALGGGYTVKSTVQPVCGGLANDAITFSTGIAVNSTTGALNNNQSASTQLSTAAFCNGVNSTLDVTTGSPLTTTPAPTDTAFTNTLTMTPSVKNNTTNTTYTGTGNPIGAFSDKLTISTGNLTASAKPVVGTYTGQINLTLTAKQ